MTSRRKSTRVAKIATGVLAAMLSLSSVGPTEGVAQAQTSQKKKMPQWMVKKKAQAAYKAGKKKMGAGDYKGALEEFKTADELYPGAAPKYNIAACYDELGMVPEAIKAYQNFIDSNPGDKYETQLAEAQKRIDDLEASMMGKVMVTVTPAGLEGMAIKVDGNLAEGTELKLEPGEHSIEVSAPGHHPQTLTVTVEQGGSQDLAVTLEPMSADTPSPEPDDLTVDVEPEDGGNGEALRIAGYVTFGLTVVGGVMTAVFGAQALSKKSDFDTTPTEELADDTEQAALLSDVFLGVTAGFGIATAVLLALGYTADDGEETAKSHPLLPEVTPLAGPTGGGASVTWTF